VQWRELKSETKQFSLKKVRTGVPNLSLTMYPFSILRDEHVPLQRVDRWKCTLKISYDKIYYRDHS